MGQKCSLAAEIMASNVMYYAYGESGVGSALITSDYTVIAVFTLTAVKTLYITDAQVQSHKQFTCSRQQQLALHEL